MSRIDDLTRLKHIRDAAVTAINFVKDRDREDLDSDQMLSLALVRLIEIMGEAANNVSPTCQNTYCRIPWREIIGMKNRVVHAYFDVDMSIIWQVVKEDIPILIEEINQAIQALE